MEILKYNPQTIGSKMITQVPRVKNNDTIGSIMNKLKRESNQLKTIDYIYVTDKNEKLVGVLSIRELFTHAKSTVVEKVMSRSLVTVSPETDAEKIAHIALKYKIKAVPVVRKGKLLGIVPTNRIISILNRSLQEDILHFAGVHKAHLEYENTMQVPLQKAVLHRIPWLLAGLIGIILIAGFIGFFEGVLEKYIILTFFIPAVVYMSDALGTQHQTLFVRDLAVLGKELKLGRYLLRQMLISLFLSLIVSGITFFIVSFFWKENFIAFVIAIAMFISLIFTSFTALMTTLIINKLHQDPALGSGPFATIVSDVSSIVIYFLVALWFL